jgi:hypothetical protein
MQACDPQIDSYEEPNILFLRGCFADDCTTIEDMFDQRIISASLQQTEGIDVKCIEYDKHPTRFINIESWIKKTNLKCWYCDCNFHNVPVFIPQEVKRSDSPDTNYGEMRVHGNFCSFNCAAAHINIEFRKCKWEKLEMLKILYYVFTGTQVTNIPPSPLKTNMIQYGGDLSICEYTDSIKALAVTINTECASPDTGVISMTSDCGIGALII